MRAAVYHGIGTIKLECRDVPTIREDELLIKVRAASICGTDLKIQRIGHFKIPDPANVVLGHEVSGEIVQVGAYVSGWKVSQRVAVVPNIGCQKCEMCRRGYNNMCPDYEAFGISIDGGFEEYMRVPAIALSGGNIVAVPDGMSWEEAAVVEPLSCCFNAWKGLEVTPEDTVLVIGPGPIGACFVQLAKSYGAKQIIMVGRRESRLREAERFGADILIDSSKVDVLTEVMRITKGRGVDVVVTAASTPDLQPLSIQCLARHGRVNFFGGLKKGTLVELDTNRIHYWGLKVLGTTGSSVEDYDRSMRYVADGQVNVKDIISHRFALSEVNAAFDFARLGEGMKTVILPGEAA